MRIPTPRVVLPAVVAVIAAGFVWPAVVQAQWRGPRSYPNPYPYPYAYGVGLTGSVRVQATPREAEVFVDGYLAGLVDEFDGFFQRLRLPAGGHQITVFLDGYRTESRDVYVEPGGDLHLKLTLAPVAPGEASEPPPAPVDVDVPELPAERRGPEPGPARELPGARAEREAFGALALRVTPADAAIRIDGEPADVLQGRDGPVIRLAAGEHTVEVSREGYQTFTERVLIQRDRTLRLTVTLVR